MTPDARALAIQDPGLVEPLRYPFPNKGPYLTDAGSEFNLELNILHTRSKQPIRGVEIEVGESKKFTDKLGRVIMRLPRGHNRVVVSGLGYLEKGNFAPAATSFEPMVLEVDLDSDAVYTLYSTGQIVPGERKILDNPGHSSGDLEAFLKNYWWLLATVGISGVGFYYLGKSKKQT
jgi:hypothetical protein